MRTTTIVTGIICILLGIGLVAGAVYHGKMWETAAIPAYVGVLWIIFGAVATTTRRRMIVMHVAALIALLLAVGGIGMGLPKLIQYHNHTLPAGATAKPLAWWGQVTLAVIMLAYLVLAIRSFIQARRWKQQNNAVASA